MGKFNGLLAGAIVAGLMAGNIALAQDEGASSAPPPKAKKHDGADKKKGNDCKGKNGCGKDKAKMKKTKKTTTENTEKTEGTGQD